jgi:hypothetical protein
MKHWMVTILILAIALACYSVGLSGPVVPLIVLGGAFELWFWIRALRTNEQKST